MTTTLAKSQGGSFMGGYYSLLAKLIHWYFYFEYESRKFFLIFQEKRIHRPKWPFHLLSIGIHHMEELSATQEEMARKEREYLRRIDELERHQVMA